MFERKHFKIKILPAHKPSSEEKVFNDTGFEWSLKPCINWLKLLTGINVTQDKTTDGKKCVLFSRLFTLYSIVMLVSNGVLSATFIFLYITQSIQVYGKGNHNSIIFIVNDAANRTNQWSRSTASDIKVVATAGVNSSEFIFIFGTHLCFFVSKNKLKTLWNSLLIIEKEFQISHETYLTVRKSVWIGLAVIPLVTIRITKEHDSFIDIFYDY